MKPRILIAHKGTQGFIRIEIAGTFENSSAVKMVSLDMLAKGVKEIIVDLEACEKLDSTFLGTLLGVGLKIKEAPKAHGALYVFNANPELKKLFRDLGLDRLILFKAGDPMK